MKIEIDININIDPKALLIFGEFLRVVAENKELNKKSGHEMAAAEQPHDERGRFASKDNKEPEEVVKENVTITDTKVEKEKDEPKRYRQTLSDEEKRQRRNAYAKAYYQKNKEKFIKGSKKIYPESKEEMNDRITKSREEVDNEISKSTRQHTLPLDMAYCQNKECKNKKDEFKKSEMILRNKLFFCSNWCAEYVENINNL